MRSPLIVLFAALSLSACGPKSPPGTSSSSAGGAADAGPAHVCPPLEERAGVGAPCVEACDCCGGACGSLTQLDGTVSRICRAPCPVPATP